ncbi:MAG: ethylbenzene dehydrogenase-related protein [Planctomycetota bacterium]
MTSRTSLLNKTALAVFASSVFWIAACQQRPAPPSGPSPVSLGGDGAGGGAGGNAAADGKALFESNCAVCHGTLGRGDGTAAYLLWPRPRDFSKGKFKIRSTPSGSLPTDEDLLASVTNGMPGTSMPSWRHLPEADRKALVERVKELAQYQDSEMDAPYNFFKERGAGTPVAVPAEPADNEKSRTLGKEMYVKAGCVKCHGETGRSDGPSAAGLKDDWDQPIRPNDFTQGIYRGGSTAKDIYLRFATGMSGTPMPAYGADQMNDEQRWALVHYVQSLAGEAPKALAAALPAGSELVAAKVSALPKDPADAAWDSIPAVDVPLMLLFSRITAPRLLRVRAAHDGKAVAFQLSWQDSADNNVPLRAEDFRDAAALMFALKGMDTPVTMGSKDQPVNVWSWKADWQIDLEKWKDVETIHPGMAVEMYPFEKGDKTTENKGNRPSGMPDHDPAYQSGRAAGNPFSEPGRKSPVEDAVAAGFGTLTSLKSDKQSVAGKGVWKDGRWAIQMSRSLASPDECCIALKAGTEVPLAFAVWDGAAGDRAGQKSVTTWYRLVLK